MKYDEQLIDELMRRVAAEVEITDTETDGLDEWFLPWLAHDLRLGLTAEEQAEDHRNARSFSERISRQIAVRNMERKLPRRELRYRGATITSDVSTSLAHSASEGCATMLDLAVAAGAGRELWDEPCERWLELPDDIPPSEHYLALRVAGDSMSPVLEPRDVILLKMNVVPRVEDMIVVRLPDLGYVVKKVASIDTGLLMLASFAAGYEPLRVPTDRSAILGTVIARFRHE